MFFVCGNCRRNSIFFPKQKGFYILERIYYHLRIIRCDCRGETFVKDKKVLIVDDQNGIRILLMEVFNSEGYTTMQAPNGKVALEIVRNEAPDLVLLDMKIPGMDGLEILKHIKEINPEIKVIMMTAYGELDMIKQASDLGALMHFTKPFDIDEMRLAVNNHLRGGGSI